MVGKLIIQTTHDRWWWRPFGAISSAHAVVTNDQPHAFARASEQFNRLINYRLVVAVANRCLCAQDRKISMLLLLLFNRIRAFFNSSSSSSALVVVVEHTHTHTYTNDTKLVHDLQVADATAVALFHSYSQNGFTGCATATTTTTTTTASIATSTTTLRLDGQVE